MAQAITLSESSLITTLEITRPETIHTQRVDIMVQDGSATSTMDFEVSPDVAEFPPGVDIQTVQIRIVDDEEREGTESFTLTLQNPGFPELNSGYPYEITIYIEDNEDVFIREQSGFVSLMVTIKCDITKSVIQLSDFEEYDKIEVYRQGDTSLKEAAVKIAEKASIDVDTTYFGSEEKYTFDLIMSNTLAGELEIRDLEFVDAGYYWCVFVGPMHTDMSGYDQILLNVKPCAGENSSLFTMATTNNTCIDVEELSTVNVTADNVLDVAEVLVETTERPDGIFTDDDVSYASDILEDIVGIGNGSPEVTESVVESVSNILGATNTRVPTNLVTNNSTSRITIAIETQVLTGLQQNDEVRVVESNLAVHGLTLDTATSMESSITGIGFAILSDSTSDFTNNSTRTYFEEDSIRSDQPPVFIFLSMDIVENLSENTDLNFIFIAYRNDFLFPSRRAFEDNLSVEGVILTASVEGDEINTSELPDPVVIEKEKESDTEVSQSRDYCHIPEPACVSWDYDMDDGNGDWSEEGCRYLGVNEYERRVCHCDHLTNFAVLVYHGENPVKSTALDVLSRIGCGLSISALVLTVIIFAAFRRLRKKARNILIHLCVSLTALYAIFIVAIDLTCPKIPCTIVAALLHYFTLTTMAWMAVEARYIYIKLVRLFDPESSDFVLKSALVAWGVPLLIVAISLGAGFKSYQNEHYCFPEVGFVVYLAILLPIAIVLIHNTVSFVLVVKSIMRPRPGQARDHSDRKLSLDRFRNSIAVSCLLGLTWIFGFLAINETVLVFQVLFCVFNSFQGVFIFILFCLIQQDVRSTVMSCLTGRETGSSTGASSTASSNKNRGERRTTYRSDGASADTFQSTGPNEAGQRGQDNAGVQLEVQTSGF